MLNLHSSRWAPQSSRTQSRLPYPGTSFNASPSQSNTNSSPHRHPSPSRPKPIPSQIRLVTRQTEHQRFLRLLRRLKHKSLLLLYSHHRALNHASSTSINGIEWPAERGEAETMFRVDFFEWYVLLERCLVCALGGVGVRVSSGFDPNGSRREEWDGETREGRVGAAREPIVGANTNGTVVAVDEPLVGDRRMFESSGGYAHRFHENVLAALDTPTRNPLYEILGMGRVREYIGIAKEFRNRWKDVDENTAGISGEELEVTIDRKLKRYVGILQDLNLDAMLGCILETLERARVVGEEELRKLGGEVRHDGTMGQGHVGMESNMADAPFEAGGDAMEWD